MNFQSSKSGKSNRPYELNSRFNGTFRFGSYDNFANFSESPSVDSSDSIITVYDECSTPVYYEESTATPLITCVE